MSVILSAFIDNIPYTATMLTVIPVIAVNLGNPTLNGTVVRGPAMEPLAPVKITVKGGMIVAS